jgi:hypothetical protein
MRFILVNGRTPRSRSSCVMCDQPVGMNFLREFGTHLVYCDRTCYAAHCQGAVLLIEGQKSIMNHPTLGDESKAPGERTLR